ncbi:hypothetical protein MMPV_000649 [Pyropia vietnamensis]
MVHLRDSMTPNARRALTGVAAAIVGAILLLSWNRSQGLGGASGGMTSPDGSLQSSSSLEREVKDDFPRDAAHCGASWTESDGFFCEPSAAWATRKQVFALQAKQQTVLSTDRINDAPAWWQSNYEPNFSCAFEQRLGNAGDGGKWVCDPTSIPSALAGRQCVVYSVGSGRRVGFEKAVHQALPDCRIFTFDHTVGEEGGKAVPPYVTFLPYGLTAEDEPGSPMRGLGSIRKELGHEPSNRGVSLEILKVDIEGEEYNALLPWLRSGALDGVRQLLIEIHGPYRSGKYDNAREIFTELEAAGWVITHKEPNLLKSGALVEYAFLKLNWKL